MSKVRVIRLMEYEYDSFETADRDMKQWQVPSSGARSFGTHEVIRSSVIVRPSEMERNLLENQDA
jgi:hypothetical protein